MWASPDRWSCPVCHGTEVLDVPDADLPAEIRRVQLLHAADHPTPFEPVTGEQRAIARRRAERSRA